MPKINRRHPARREFTEDHFIQLACGSDFFNTAWSSPVQIARRSNPRRFADDIGPDEWPTAEALDEMRECWEQRRAEVEAIAAKTPPGIAWAELVFDRGLEPLDALQELVDLKLAQDYPDGDLDDSELPAEFRGL
jgi:hypothetical protein